ncbi:MAG: hypothetical protein Fur005_22630 [Roseiflexaceae bacterium]
MTPSEPLENPIKQQAEQPVYDELVESYETSFRQAIEQDGTIYEPMTTIIEAGHERRIELLDQLPIGDISNKVCVDYGVGSWGFARIYPRLQQCTYAIGIDISEAAVQESAAISARGSFPYGQNYRYFTSRGDNILLDTESVDIFFAGESIEHVENTAAFLDEVHRVLKPQGIFLLTTPNADAYLFRCHQERYAVGPEHVALMGYHELVTYLDPRFEIIQAHSFNGSVHPFFDNQISDPAFAKVWAAQFRDQPEYGTGLVIMARRKDDYQSRSYQHQFYHHTHTAIEYTGNWSKIPLHKAMTGRVSSATNDSFTLSFSGEGIILHFWMHDWSGIVEVTIDGTTHQLNLYSPRGGFERLVIDALPHTNHQMVVRVTGQHDPRSHSHEVTGLLQISVRNAFANKYA